MIPLPNQFFLTPKEVASILRLSPSSVYRMVDEGKLKAVKLDGLRGSVRIPRNVLEKALEVRTTL